MTDDGEGSFKKPVGGADPIRLPDAKQLSGSEITDYVSDARTYATLRKIAEHLCVPIDRFLTKPASVRSDASSKSLNNSEQELRLLSAFGRITDPAVRDQIINLAEALALNTE